MQTIRDVVEEVIKDALKYLEKKKGLEVDSFLEEALMLQVLGNTKIRQVKNKTIKSIVRKSSPEKPIVLGTHTLVEIRLCQLAAEHNNIEYNKLFVKCREREVVDTRMHLAAVMYNYVGHTVSKVGQIFSKDHSTVINWLNNHMDLTGTNKVYSKKYNDFLEIVKKEMPFVFDSIHDTKSKVRTFRVLAELGLKKERHAIRKAN